MSTLADLQARLAAATNDEQRAEAQRALDEFNDEGANPPAIPPNAENQAPPQNAGGGLAANAPQGPQGATPMSRAPTLAVFEAFQYRVESNAVATPAQIDEISRVWATLGVPADSMFTTALDLARHCADVGSSPYVSLIGRSPPCNLQRDALAAAIRTQCTLRQFCMFYAKFVWNLLKMSNTPPANWQKLEFRETEKFAAFDFFDGVLHEAALKPPQGVISPPSPAELAASKTNAYVAISRARQQQPTKLTFAAEVNKGQLRVEEMKYLEAP
ncbi:coat protein [Euonymus yellow mottle associated virus]|uniref:Coat protein n=1 Tax=Euonymus yellow mottle associated virus TaxID=2586645 RepID=A0A4Y5R5Q9_9VIRU|nr:coat protein [Euonymus yellow mottle associated virus]QCY52828.1 coat protein [Euonymus yellow mottle associated virus]